MLNDGPHLELSVVCLRCAFTDDRGRLVEAGSEGTIVAVHTVPLGAEPAYEIEVPMFSPAGAHNDSHLFTARHGQLSLVAAAPSAR